MELKRELKRGLELGSEHEGAGPGAKFRTCEQDVPSSHSPLIIIFTFCQVQ